MFFLLHCLGLFVKALNFVEKNARNTNQMIIHHRIPLSCLVALEVLFVFPSALKRSEMNLHLLVFVNGLFRDELKVD